MGLSDRDYHRNPPPQGMGGMPRQPSRLASAPVVKWLLIINIAVYFSDMLFFDWRLSMWGHFSAGYALEKFQLWRFLSFQFLHADGRHLLFNMLGLFFFGHFAERWWGSKKFLYYYLATGVAGAVLYVILYYVGWFGKAPIQVGDELLSAAYIPLVGASAGIFGILACVAVIAPNLRVYLFFVIPMSMRLFAIGALVFSTVIIITNGDNAGGEAGHLGGAILGFALMKFPHFLNFAKEKRKGGRKVVEAQVLRDSKMRPRISINLDDSEIDRILDKVNSEGLQSLTEEERDLLRRIAEQ
ncbi:MAG: rhomboid family intramembrane serine protease [Akkermansiaceae bacterium]